MLASDKALVYAFRFSFQHPFSGLAFPASLLWDRLSSQIHKSSNAFLNCFLSFIVSRPRTFTFDCEVVPVKSSSKHQLVLMVPALLWQCLLKRSRYSFNLPLLANRNAKKPTANSKQPAHLRTMFVSDSTSRSLFDRLLCFRLIINQKRRAEGRLGGCGSKGREKRREKSKTHRNAVFGGNEEHPNNVRLSKQQRQKAEQGGQVGVILQVEQVHEQNKKQRTRIGVVEKIEKEQRRQSGGGQR